jgi:hypothetical protein
MLVEAGDKVSSEARMRVRDKRNMRPAPMRADGFRFTIKGVVDVCD